VITYKSEVLLARTCKCPHRGKNDLTGLVCLYSSVLIKAGLHVHTHTHTPHDDIGRAYHADSSFDYKLTSSVIIILKIEVPLYR